MGRFVQTPPEKSKGSLKDIQVLVNDYLHVIDEILKRQLPDLAKDEIVWRSPLKEDEYAEYRDDDFINRLSLPIVDIQLKFFWPSGGPQWDALAVTNSGKVILVEAKANIPEMVSPATQAKGKSKELIIRSLEETKGYLNIKSDVDWAGKFYQYTNRLAHLYYLCHRCGVEAYLANVNFVGDEIVAGPATVEEWQAALQVLHAYLGTGRHKLKKYMADIFVDVRELGIGN